MTSGEFAGTPHLEQLMHEAVRQFKVAAMYRQSPDIVWPSLNEDRMVLHQATPLHQDRERADITQIGELPGRVFDEVFNSWTMIRGEVADDNSRVSFTQYTIENWRVRDVRHTTYERRSDGDSDDILRFVEGLRETAEHGLESDLRQPTEDEILHLQDALLDLEVFTNDWRKDFAEKRRNMTREERLAERAMRFRAIDAAEVDKIRPAKYWIVDAFMAGRLYAVRANDGSIAAAIIDEHIEEAAGYRLPIISHAPLEDEFEAKFDEILPEDKEFIRLIPHSREPWPDDPENMTPAQQAAIDRLKKS